MKAILSEALLAFTDHHIAVRSITPSDNISCFTMTAFVITLLIRTINLPLIPTILFKDSRCKIHWFYILNIHIAVRQPYFRTIQVKMDSVSWLFDNHDFVVIRDNIINNIFLFHALGPFCFLHYIHCR